MDSRAKLNSGVCDTPLLLFGEMPAETGGIAFSRTPPLAKGNQTDETSVFSCHPRRFG
jgi:hypothetical protein